MKSIVEEASSISKAIEKAWEKAGKPVEFSIKVFQQPETSFLWFTKKPAKIGIFFDDQKQVLTHHREPLRKAAPKKTDRPERPVWNPALIQAAEKWLDGLLKRQSIISPKFTLKPESSLLRVILEQGLSDQLHDKILKKSIAHLLLTSLQHKFKREAGGLKVSISSR